LSVSTRSTAILIVEDNERNLKLVRDILQYNGYETLEARNAEDGLALALERRPDLILMDIQLPDLDGVTALARLRADPRTASVRVAALTAFAMSEDRQRLLAAGFDGYLEKPIDVRAFPGQVLSLLHSTRLEESR
jgi:two-component system cell cycle response regulator DivK